MRFSEERIVNAPISIVWKALHDVAVLENSIPGCEALEHAGQDTFEGRLRLKIGPVSVRLSGKVHLSGQLPPHFLQLTGQGAGVMGIAKGTAEVTLTEVSDAATRLSYEASVEVGGKIAQLGSRLIGSTANRLAAQFFESFGAATEEGTGAPQPEVAQ